MTKKCAGSHQRRKHVRTLKFSGRKKRQVMGYENAQVTTQTSVCCVYRYLQIYIIMYTVHKNAVWLQKKDIFHGHNVVTCMYLTCKAVSTVGCDVLV